MHSPLLAALVSVALGFGATLAAGQDVVINRLPASTVRGIIVEVSCFREQGAAAAATAEQIACAKARITDGGRLGILTEGDGLFQITGPLAASKFARLLSHIGKRVDMSGAEVVISNNYDYRSFEAQKVVPVTAK